MVRMILIAIIAGAAIYLAMNIPADLGPPAKEVQLDLPTLQAGVGYGLMEFEMVGVLSAILLLAVAVWIRWYTHRPRDTEGNVMMEDHRPPNPIRR